MAKSMPFNIIRKFNRSYYVKWTDYVKSGSDYVKSGSRSERFVPSRVLERSSRFVRSREGGMDRASGVSLDSKFAWNMTGSRGSRRLQRTQYRALEHSAHMGK